MGEAWWSARRTAPTQPAPPGVQSGNHHACISRSAQRRYARDPQPVPPHTRELISALEGEHPDGIVEFVEDGHPGVDASYRGHCSDLAFERALVSKTVGDLLAEYREMVSG